MEAIACALCGQDDAEVVVCNRDLFTSLPQVFCMLRCRQCGLLYLSPRPMPTEMESHYPPDYIGYVRAIEDNLFFLRRWDRRRRLRKLCQIAASGLRGGKLLDVGCATGIFMAEMRRFGDWDLYGVEPNMGAASYARARLGLNVFEGMLEEACFVGGSFDVVTLWDVLEHVNEPLATLGEVRRVLRPGGLLALTTPNLQSFDRLLTGRYWAGYDIPRHLYLFSEPVLKQMLEQAGFIEMESSCSSNSYFSFVQSIKMYFWAHPRLKLSDWFFSQVAYFPGMELLFAPFFAPLDRCKRGTTLMVLAR